MKNVFLTMLAVALSFGAFAQETTPAKDTIPMEQKTQKKDIYVMKDNKMWQIKAGEKTELTEDVTLANGTIVMANGTVKTTDGQTTMLKNGQYVDLEGNIGDWKDDSAK
jgi:hypothetical protein